MLPKSEPSECPFRRPGEGQKEELHPPRVSPGQTDRLTDVGPVPAVSHPLGVGPCLAAQGLACCCRN